MKNKLAIGLGVVAVLCLAFFGFAQTQFPYGIRVGSSDQFQVDSSGNITSSGTFAQTGSPTYSTLTVTGTSTHNGDVVLGNAATDSLTVGAGPSTFTNATAEADALILGADAKFWRSGTGTTTTNGSVTVTSNTTVGVNLQVNGNATIGNAAGDAHTITGATSVATSLAVGGGTALTGILLGSGTVANGSTTGTITLTGCSTSYYPFVTIANATSNGVGVESAVTSTNAVSVTLTGDPGASNATIRVLAIKP